MYRRKCGCVYLRLDNGRLILVRGCEEGEVHFNPDTFQYPMEEMRLLTEGEAAEIVRELRSLIGGGYRLREIQSHLAYGFKPQPDINREGTHGC